MNHPIFCTALAGMLVLAGSAMAQREPNTPPTSQFSLSYRAGINISASFENLGGLSSTADPGPATGGGIDRFYDDGYLRVDSSGNAGGQTWFWGYQSAAQLPGNDTVVMRSTSSATDVSSRNRSDDPQHGFELTWNLEWPTARVRGFLGLEAAFNFMDLEITDNRRLLGNATQVADAFPLNGIIPPLAPYNGTFSGPGATIGDAPARTTSAIEGGAAISGVRRIDAPVYGLRLGPAWRLALSDSVSFSLGGGLALAIADSEFSFVETVVLTGGGSATRSGSDRHVDFLAGGYAAAKISVALSRSWSVVAGAQYQNIGSYSQRAGAKVATVDLGESIFVTGGINLAF